MIGYLSKQLISIYGRIYIGHLSLVKEAHKMNNVVIASIFVNPTQFGVGEDLDKYPRQFEKDVQLLSELGVVSVYYCFVGKKKKNRL